MSNPYSSLINIFGLSAAALAVGYLLMPSNEQKAKRMREKYPDHRSHGISLQPEVAQKAKEEVERDKQFMDAIKRAKTSDRTNYGKRSDQ